MRNAICILFVLAAAVCEGRVITVDDDGPADFATIQAAIDDANDGDTVEIQPGRYTGPGNRDIDFHGKAITVRSTDPEDANIVEQTIIDCNDMGRGFYFNNGEDANSVLIGLTITNGYAQDGGGVYCDGSSPTISKCVISDNTAVQHGGGIFCTRGSNARLLGCRITGNGAEITGGGGVSCTRGSNLYISECLIARNWSNTSHSGFGAGAYTIDSDPLFRDCVIEGNGPACWAGGVYSTGQDRAGPRFENCFIRFNYGTETGAGRCYCYSATFVNCLITGNRAAWYTGGFKCDGDTRFDNCTIAGNYCPRNGPGLYCRDRVAVTNCIIWGNLSGVQAVGPICGNPDISYSNVQFGWAGEGNIDAEPQFAFFDPDSFYNDFHVMPGSPCIDSGTASLPDGLIPSDLDGTPRPIDGDNDGLESPDMGAYEYDPEAARIAASRETLSFCGPTGGPNPPSRKLILKNTGGRSLSCQIDFQVPWMQAPRNPVISETGTALDISVETEALSPGQYEETLLISAPESVNSPVPLTILLTVGRQRHVPSEYQTIQAAIDASGEEGDAVILAPQLYTGEGNRDIVIKDKSIMVCSSEPSDPCVVAATVIDCEGTAAAERFGFDVTVDIPFPGMQPEQVILDGLTVTGAYQDGDSTIRCLGYGSVIISRCIVHGNVGQAIRSYSYDALISKCTITDNTAPSSVGIIRCGDGTRITGSNISRNHAEHGGGVYCLGYENTAHLGLRIDHSIISGNSAELYGGGVSFYRNSVVLDNVTIVGNRAGGFGGGVACLRGSTPLIENSIICDNAAPSGDQIALVDVGPAALLSPKATLSFCAFPTGPENIYTDPNAHLNMGPGNIEVDPSFVDGGHWDSNGTPEDANDDFWVDGGDYHLMSQGGRWDANEGRWVRDEVTSPCIDAGDPMSPIGMEPFASGGIINMGAYGGTLEASKSYFGKPPCETIVAGDVNGDCLVDFRDFQLMALHWCEEW